MTRVSRIGLLAMSLILAGPPITPALGQSVHLGVVGGATHAIFQSTYVDLGIESARSRWSPSGGLFVQWDMSRRWSVRMAGLYVRKGFDRGRIGGMRTAYVELPILVVRALDLGPDWLSPSIFGGIAPSHEESCRAWSIVFEPPPFELALGPPQDDVGPPLPVRRQPCRQYRTRLWDFGAVLGSEIGVDVSGIDLTVNVRYTHGLRNIGQDLEDVRAKNRTWMYMLGASVPIISLAD